MEISKAPSDGGLAHKVCSLHTLEILGFTKSDLKAVPYSVKAYDNSRQELFGVFVTSLNPDFGGTFWIFSSLSPCYL